jgi:hypothetical protein
MWKSTTTELEHLHSCMSTMRDRDVGQHPIRPFRFRAMKIGGRGTDIARYTEMMSLPNSSDNLVEESGGQSILYCKKLIEGRGVSQRRFGEKHTSSGD